MNVDRPALTALVLFGLLGLGFAVVALGLNREPKATPPAKKEEPNKGPELLPLPREVEKASRALHVAVAAPGFSVEVIEETVAVPLERAFIGRPGIDSVQTHIEQGRCRLTLKLAADRDEPQARAEAINTISGILPQLPQDIQPPILDWYDPGALPAFWIAALGDGIRSEIQIGDVMRNEVRKSLLTIPGISEVELRGDREQQLSLNVQPEKLQALNLTLSDVIDAVSKMDAALDADGIKKLERAVLAKRKDASIFMHDVATLSDGSRSDGFARHGGKRAVLAGIHIAAGANARDVGAAVRARLRELKVPEGIILQVVADATRNTEESMLIECRFPVDTTRDKIDQRTEEIERKLREQLGQRDIAAILTLGQKPGSSVPAVQMLVPLAAGHLLGMNEVQTRIRKIAAEFPDVRARIIIPEGGASSPRRAELPIRLVIVGEEFDLLHRWTAEILRLSNQEASGLVDASTDSLVVASDVQVRIDRDRAEALGVSTREILNTVAAATGTQTVDISGISITVSLGGENPNRRPEDLGNLPVRANNDSKVLLKDVVKLERIEALTTIDRWNGQRCAMIVANPKPGTALREAEATLRKIAGEAHQKLKLPAFCQIIGP